MPNYEEEKRIAAFSASVLVNVDQDGKAQSYEYGYARVGAEVFILDFPLGLALQGVLPIWKRGSIVSEPLVANRQQSANFLRGCGRSTRNVGLARRLFWPGVDKY
jgi:hypothetical protein